MKHIQNAEAFACAQIDSHDACLIGVLQFLQRFHMAASQIHDVDIVPHASTVGSLIVSAKNLQLVASAHRNLCNIGQQVVGNVRWVFANQATWVCTDRVEVAQHCHGPVRRGFGEVCKYFLNHQLAAAVRVHSRRGVRFVVRQVLGHAVNSG